MKIVCEHEKIFEKIVKNEKSQYREINKLHMANLFLCFYNVPSYRLFFIVAILDLITLGYLLHKYTENPEKNSSILAIAYGCELILILILVVIYIVTKQVTSFPFKIYYICGLATSLITLVFRLKEYDHFIKENPDKVIYSMTFMVFWLLMNLLLVGWFLSLLLDSRRNVVYLKDDRIAELEVIA